MSQRDARDREVYGMFNLGCLDRLLSNAMLFAGLFLLINGVRMVANIPTLLSMMEGEVLKIMVVLTIPTTWLLSFHVFQRAITELLRVEFKESTSDIVKGEGV